MNLKSKESITLIELVLSIIILGLMVIGLSSIDTFSNFQVISSDRRAKLQHDAAFVLEHMSQNIARAIGNEQISGANPIVIVDTNPNDVLLRVYIDASGNGQRENEVGFPPGPTVAQDHWIAYRYDSVGGPGVRDSIRYCGRCRNNSCLFPQCLDNEEVLSRERISLSGFVPSYTSGNNFVKVDLTTCWDPDAPPCGTTDNPSVEMQNNIYMPAVSVN